MTSSTCRRAPSRLTSPTASTEVGHHCVGAKVNGKLVPLEYKLKNGDIVSVITNKANNG